MEAQSAEVMAAHSSSTETLGQAEAEAETLALAESESMDPMEEFSRQLEDIINTYGSVTSLIEKQNVVAPGVDKLEEEMSGDDATAAKETGAGKDQKAGKKRLGKEATALMQSLNKLRSPEEKLEAVLKKYAEVVEERWAEQRQQRQQQHIQTQVVKERDQLQSDNSRAILARSKLESLCRELQRHNRTLKEETLQRCRVEEEKRKEITGTFQSTLTTIQAQIEQHSGRNAKLCQENANLADKLKSIINQYEQREESLEKIFKHRDLQQKLSDAKLEQAQAQLQEAQEKHHREKEYLLREAIDKTKKCYALKQEELQLKKKLVLYSEKFDEFQTTLARSNDVYASFKGEMEKMTKKMKKLDKQSNIWKTRFESCNKALVNMIEERSEKEQEFELFCLRIDKLEKLCRALQDERQGLYKKIKEIRHATADQAQSGPAVEVKIPELVVEEEEGVMTEEMARLRAEQARLQAFAASLLEPPADGDDSDSAEEEEATEEEEKEEKKAPDQVEGQAQQVSETKPEAVRVEVVAEVQGVPSGFDLAEPVAAVEVKKSPEAIPAQIEAGPQPTAPVQMQATEPILTPVADPIEKAPVPVPVENTPVAAPVEKTPLPIEKAPVAAPVEKAPVPVPVENTPVAAPVEKAPLPATVEKAPVAAPVEKAPVPVPVEKTPVAAPVEKAPLPAPVEKAPLPAPAEKAPVPVPVEKTPVATPVEKCPLPLPVEKASVPAQVEKAPVGAAVEKAPLEAAVEKAPVEAAVEKAPVPTEAPVEQAKEVQPSKAEPAPAEKEAAKAATSKATTAKPAPAKSQPARAGASKKQTPKKKNSKKAS